METPKSFWGTTGVAVRDGEPILCEVEATPLGVLFRPVLTQKVQGKIQKIKKIQGSAAWAEPLNCSFPLNQVLGVAYVKHL